MRKWGLKISCKWGPDMMRQSGHEAQQVRCLSGDQGSEWIHGLDGLPAPIRRRLCESRHNICPTCLHIEAARNTRKGRRPALVTYSAVLRLIEHRLDGGGGGDA
jgi:hypothetical protein